MLLPFIELRMAEVVQYSTVLSVYIADDEGWVLASVMCQGRRVGNPQFRRLFLTWLLTQQARHEEDMGSLERH